MSAMEENEDWMNESGWEDSKLSFILVHRDQEQSGINWRTALETLQSYREDTSTVTINAISGPPPVGCDGGVVEYPLNYHEAITESDGLIVSACESDWTTNWESMAAHTMNGSAFYTLEGTVLESSIQVTVNGEKWTSGWSFDEGFNSVVFDSPEDPPSGSTVTINYLLGGGCGE